MPRLALLACLLCTFLLVRGQSVIPRFETINVNEGLSQSSVYNICQDRTGFMWFSTADGLNRYDGHSIRIYKVEDSQLNMDGNFIRGALCEDESSNLWFANEAGIHYYSRLHDRILTVRKFSRQEYGGNAFDGLFLRKGRLWMMNNFHGIFSYDLRSGKLRQYTHPLFRDRRTHLPLGATTDSRGNVWFSFFLNEGLYRFNTDSATFTHQFAGTDVFRLDFGRGRHFRVGLNGIVIYDSARREEQPFRFRINGQPVKSVIQVFEDPFGRLWGCALGEGVLCYDPSTGQTRQYRHDNSRQKSLPIDIVRVCYIDRGNNLWIGTDGGGAARLDLKPPRFNLFPLNEGDYPFLSDYFTKCFYEDGQGLIWFGTHNNGFNIFDPRTGSLKNYSSYNGKPLRIVGSITPDAAGRICIGHALGVSLFDAATGRFTDLPFSNRPRLTEWGSFVCALAPLGNGDLLAATGWGMLHFRKKGETYAGRCYYGAGYLGSTATSLQQDRDGTVWVTSPVAGLLQIAVSDTLKIVSQRFAGVNIRSLHFDETAPGVIWLSTAKGLIRFVPATGQTRIYTVADGMANSYVYGVTEDEKHNFWLSTNGGLLYFDRAAERFFNFTVNDGLQSNEFNTGAFYKGPSGTFYFGGIRGFNWFRQPVIPRESPLRPGVAITAIAINDRPWQPDSAFMRQPELRLPYRSNNISLQFAALDYTRPEANRLQYKLEGLDPQWTTTYSKSIRYPNLAPGSYTFRVRAINAGGAESEEAGLRLLIAAPFWKRWWFYLVLGLTAVITIVLITRAAAQARLRRQLQELEKRRAVEAERDRISRDMHDEIGSGLTHIALLGELVHTQPRTGTELKTDVATISAAARRLVETMGEIIWALNPQNDTLENLLAYLREQTVAFLEPFEMHYLIRFPEAVPRLRLTNEQRRNLYLVAREALNNALKHAAASEITLSFAVRESLLHFTVKDNGHGLDLLRAKVSSNGLRNMHKRMEDIGGFYEISTSAFGTEVHFGLAVKQEAAYY